MFGLSRVPSRRHARHEPKGPQIVEYPFRRRLHTWPTRPTRLAARLARMPSLAPMPDAELILIVEETDQHAGRFHAALDGRRLCTSRTPLLSAARVERLLPLSRTTLGRARKILDRQAGNSCPGQPPFTHCGMANDPCRTPHRVVAPKEPPAGLTRGIIDEQRHAG